MENFRIQLYRNYPQVARAVEILVADYNAVISSAKIGTLEIESFFGKMHFNKGSQTFDNNLSVHAMSSVLGMLESYIAWDKVDGSCLVYDYYIDKTDRVRVTQMENGERSVHNTRKVPLNHKDFLYTTSDGWELSDYILRVNMKLEIEDTAPADIKRFESVKISTRKAFTIQSSNVPTISYKFDVIHYWTGKTLKEAEDSMMNAEPRRTIECEIVNIPTDNSLSDKDKFLMFASMLMKMQDFLEYPTCYESAVEKNYSIQTPGVFTLVQ